MPPRSKPPTTVSGYPKRDVYRALAAALASRDPERSCCLAAELALTPDEPRALACFMADAFAQHYASADGEAIVRMYRCLSSVWNGMRSAVCEASVIMSVGLPRQNLSDLLRRSVRSECLSEHGQLLCSDLTYLSKAIMSGDAHEAISISLRMLASANKGHGGKALYDKEAMSACAVWDACLGSDKDTETVRSAYSLYHMSKTCDGTSVPPLRPPSPSPSKTQRASRINLALSGVLLACACVRSHSHGARFEMPSTWAGPSADAMVKRACDMSGSLFDGILQAAGRGTAAPLANADDHADVEDPAAPLANSDDHADVEDPDENENENEPRGSSEHANTNTVRRRGGTTGDQDQTQLSYLQLYTKYDYATLSRAADARRDVHAATVDTAPVKTINLQLQPSTAHLIIGGQQHKQQQHQHKLFHEF